MAKPQKIELPADLTQAFPIPEDATIADIDAMVKQIAADAEKLLGEKNTNLDGANWLLDTVDQLNAKKGELVTAEAERQETIKAAQERLAAANAAGGDDDDEDGDDDADGDDSGDGVTQTGDIQGVVDNAPGADAPAPVLVASAGVIRRRASYVSAAAKNGGKPPVLPAAKTREASLLAAADIPGFQAGQSITMTQMADAAVRRFGTLPAGRKGSARSQLSIGSVQVESDPGLVASGQGEFIDPTEAVAWALSPERLERESGRKAENGMSALVAAGGWCAPSETLYDLFDPFSTDGLLDIAGITVNRGGVRFTLGPDFTAVYNAGANFTRTETQAIAGLAKPIVNIPCPTFADHRMVVDGLYLTGDILSQKGYPEAYTDYLNKSMTAFAHYVNAQTIADIEALSTVVDMTAGSPPPYDNAAISTELLGAIEIQILDMRYRNRLSKNQAVEVVLPYWLIGAVRSDIAKRAYITDPLNISDADITAYFAARGASVQWVYDWQDAFTGVSGGFGASTPIKAYPATAKFLIYPEGTFVRALSDVIELNAVYDSALLTTNQYVALFLEQARLTLKRGFDAREVTVNVKVTGAVGAAYDYTTKQPNI